MIWHGCDRVDDPIHTSISSDTSIPSDADAVTDISDTQEAECEEPCTDQEKWQTHQDVSKYCKTPPYKPESCKSTMSTEELIDNMNKFRRCYEARLENMRCYNGGRGAAGHRKEANEALNGAKRCAEFLQGAR